MNRTAVAGALAAGLIITAGIATSQQDPGPPDGGVIIVSQPPQPGDVQKMLTVEAYVPDSALSAMSSAGIVFDGGGHYQVLRVRYWYFLDGGLDVGPSWPTGVVVIAQYGPTICSSSQVCVAYDGGIDPALATNSGCVCAVDSTCLGTNPQGVINQPVPHGITLPGAGWTGPFTGNCFAKPACGSLWTNFSSGGVDDGWPAQCPRH